METPRKNNWPTTVFYICMFLGLIGLLVYLVDDSRMPEEFVISGFFAALGGVAFVKLLQTRRTLWRWLTFFAWMLAIIGFGVYLTDTANVPEGLMIAAVFPSIGALVYALFNFYPAQAQPPQIQTQFRQLGDPEGRLDPLQNPAERDVPVGHRPRGH